MEALYVIDLEPLVRFMQAVAGGMILVGLYVIWRSGRGN